MFQETLGRMECFSLCKMPPSPLNYTRIVFRYRQSKELSWKGEKDRIYKHSVTIETCLLPLVQLSLKR